MKPVTLTAEQKIIRNDQIATKAMTTVRSALKTMNRFWDDYSGFGKDGIYNFTFACPEPKSFMDMAKDIINMQERCIVVDSYTSEGKFDWLSNTYIKPTLTIKFKVR